MIKNVLICGLGAIGTIYAARFLSYKENITLKILLDEKRLKFYQDNPTTFNGNFLNLEYILPNEKTYQADLILITTKYQDFKKALENISNFITQETIILSLLNGISTENIIEKKYPFANVIKSFVIGHSSMRNGRSIEHDNQNKLVFGSEKPSDLIYLNKLKILFDNCKISCEISQDILFDYWQKFTLNILVNQMSAILNANFYEMQNIKTFKFFAENILKEVVSVANKEGIKNSEKLIEKTWKQLYQMLPTGRTSMLQDLQAKRVSEIELFSGEILKLAKKHNIETPYNKIIYEIIKMLEEKNSLSYN